MKKITVISLVASIIAIIIVITAFVLSRFNNTSENIVSKSKTNVVILVDEKTINDTSDIIQAKFIVENHNDFDINMFNVSFQDNDLYFNLNNDGVYTISKNDTLKCNFTIEFNNKTKSKDYLSLLKNKNILINFNASDANQNDKVTQIKPKISQEKAL